MDNLRLLLLFSLAFIVLMLWQAWNQDYGQPSDGGTETTSSEAVPSGTDAAPSPLPGTAGTEVPSAPVVATATDGSTPLAQVQPVAATANTVKVITDLYTLEIDTKGGNIVDLLLNDYPVSLEEKDKKFQLLRPTPPNLSVSQSGLIGAEDGDAPTHESQYQAAQDLYRMPEGSDQLDVNLSWKNSAGVEVIKRFHFERGTYLVNISHEVTNNSGADWSGREYRQLLRGKPTKGENDPKFVYTYTGGAIYTPDNKYQKIKFDDMEETPLSLEVKGGWIAMLQHYFLSAWVPPSEETDHFYSNVLPGERYVLGAYTPPVNIPAGGSHTFSSGFLAGPKLQDELEQIAPGLELTVDYGWLTVVAKPIFWLMKQIHSLIGNWGWSIILLTLVIKLAFFKLSETSYKSMANMRKMTPRIQALKDRFGDDKQRLNQAMMEMYKKEKINPLGGCLPIVVQIPVFIALYWVLLESVELRQAPFIFWIKDLSIKDPYFVLPVVMGITMFIQQRLNPAPPDPMQAKLMMALPFEFTIFFATMPAGLVVYWVTNNILSISQQWYITRQIEKAG